MKRKQIWVSEKFLKEWKIKKKEVILKHERFLSDLEMSKYVKIKIRKKRSK